MVRCKQEEQREVGGEKREERGQKRNQNLGLHGLGSCVITPTVIREDLSSSNRQRRRRSPMLMQTIPLTEAVVRANQHPSQHRNVCNDKSKQAAAEGT